MGKLGRLTSARIQNVRPWNHASYTPQRFARLLEQHAKGTGEHLPSDSQVLDFVPLMHELSDVEGVSHDGAVWLVVAPDGSTRMLIERPASDIPAVDVILAKLGEYNAAHRQLVQLMITATRHDRSHKMKASDSETEMLPLLKHAAESGVESAVLARRDVSFAEDD